MVSVFTMLYPFTRLRSKRVVLLVAACFLVWIWKYPKTSATRPDASTLAIGFPLVWKHIHMFNGTGGGTFSAKDLCCFHLSSASDVG